ncbi:MAG TPA: TlpA disulfide reductase family protein [Chitinophagaceae bacterium]|nr:TlpA disulfide reductase family protein [Chitinophagaceae bacterium]
MFRIVLLFLFIISACKNTTDTKGSNEVPDKITQKDNAMTRVHLTDLHDQPIELEKFKGKTVFINFWATWCKPCREEMPSVQEAMKILKDEKIEFLFASDETTEQIEEFKAAHEYSFNYVKVESLSSLNIIGLPTTFIFNSSGELVFSEMGYRKWDNKANIDLILNNAKPK